MTKKELIREKVGITRVPKENEYLRKLFSLQDSLIESEISSPFEDENDLEMNTEIDNAFKFIKKEIMHIKKNKLVQMREKYEK